MPYLPISRPLSLAASLAVQAAFLPFAEIRAQVQLEPRWSTQIEALTDGQDPLVPLETNDIAVGDVDGDGDLDLLFVLDTGGAALMRNDGDGRFERSWLTVSSGFQGAVALFDADGDGDLDALLASGKRGYGASGPSALLTNDGTGQFTEVVGAVPAQLLYTLNVQVGDLDGDLDLDLVINGATSIHVWRNDGTGTFADVTAAAFVTPPPGADARLGDVDGDGDLDLVTRSAAYGNDGAGHFAPIVGWPSWPVLGLDLADLDGDGDLDLVSPDQVLRNDGGLVFTPLGSLPAGTGPGNAADLFANNRRFFVDVDGDGLTDILGVDLAARPMLLRNTGGFVFQDATAAWFEPHALTNLSQAPNAGIGFSRGACAVFDADGDGDLDLVTGGGESRNGASTTVGIPPRVFLNAGQTDFVEASRGSFPWHQDTSAVIAAADVDGDGDLDLLFSYLGSVYLNWRTSIWRQDRAGHFAEDAAPVTIRTLSDAVFVDVDGDGDLDLFGAAGLGPNLMAAPAQHVLALNDGDGNFTEVSAARLPATAVSSGGSCAAGDVDGDGDQDLIVGSYDPGGSGSVPLMLLRNDGTGTFTDASTQLPPLGTNARRLVLCDLDGDGDLDLLVADGYQYYSSPTPTLYFANDGTGTFTDVTTARVPAGAGWGLDVQDLDGDGDLDVAQRGATLWNDGTGTFTATPAAARLLTADFDRDGNDDDVTSNNGNSLVVGGVTIPFGQNVWEYTVLPVDIDGDQDLDLVVACQLGYQDPNWCKPHIGILHNRYRDLEAVSLPRVGQPYRLRVRGRTAPPGMLAVFATSPGALPQPVPIPGIEGTLVVDPATLFFWGLTVVPDSTTAVDGVLPLAADPSLNGLECATQALFVPVDGVTPMGLSNGLVHTLRW